tara:strand:+ start:1074 stop:1592 length:519 start_codon:yes stop_codon:yes gene_type:complete
MSKTLIVYSTTDGQTKNICEKIIKIGEKKETIDLFSIDQVSNLSISKYRKIIIGASIRYGKHNPLVYEFIKLNKEELGKKFTAFFTVNVVARKKEKNLPETNPYMKKFLELSGWQPNKLAVFAGRIDYPSYRFFDRLIIRFIMLITKGPTDTTQTYEFTDWKRVEEFAKEVL